MTTARAADTSTREPTTSAVTTLGAEHVAHRLKQRLGAADDDQHALLSVEAAVDQIHEQRGGGLLAFSVEPSHNPSGCMTPSTSIPSATTQKRSLRSIPSSISAARRRSSSGRDINSIRFSRVLATNSRLTADLLVDLGLRRGRD
jgi:hypothetical protein